MRKKILSFDGGGIRGVIAVVFLKRLEVDTGLKLIDAAEMLAGTSTGSIIAGALAAGMATDDILSFYVHKSGEIFKEEPQVDAFLDLSAKFSSDNLYRALEEAFLAKGIDPKISLRDLKKKIVIPTVNLDDQTCDRWRTEILTNKTDVALIDAMMRSSAAPTYFPSYTDCIDGGIAANDPAVLAYAELDDKEQPCLLSFGTGYVNHNVFKGKHWGALSWIVDIDQKSVSTKTPLLSMLFDAQDQLPGQIAALILKENYKRINLKLAEAVALDDVLKIPQLIREAETFVQDHPNEWRAICEWVTLHFKS